MNLFVQIVLFPIAIACFAFMFNFGSLLSILCLCLGIVGLIYCAIVNYFEKKNKK